MGYDLENVKPIEFDAAEIIKSLGYGNTLDEFKDLGNINIALFD